MSQTPSFQEREFTEGTARLAEYLDTIGRHVEELCACHKDEFSDIVVQLMARVHDARWTLEGLKQGREG